MRSARDRRVVDSPLANYMETKLTQRVVEAAGPPRSGQSFIRDTEPSGFPLRMSFVWEGRVRGRPKRMTITSYLIVSVFLTREEVINIRAAIAAARDPIREAGGATKRTNVRRPCGRISLTPCQIAQEELLPRRANDRRLPCANGGMQCNC
jgi:hypothetical protein